MITFLEKITSIFYEKNAWLAFALCGVLLVNIYT